MRSGVSILLPSLALKTKSKQAPDSRFLVVSYSILAQSLGSSCIHWVMKIPPDLSRRIEQIASPMKCKDWINEYLSNPYKKHFHKNYPSGDKIKMRQLWSEHIRRPEDIPVELTGLTFVSEDCVSYSSKNKAGEVVTEIAHTLRGILASKVPTMFEELYSSITAEECYFQWQYRGPRIFEKITSVWPEVGLSPDLVVLTEYDVHDIVEVYRRGGGGSSAAAAGASRETFAEAMSSSGYSGCLMTNPFIGDISGNGIFWKSSAFQMVSVSGKDVVGSPVFILNPGAAYCDAAFNFDLHESPHVLERHKSSEGDTLSATMRSMPETERKHVGIVRLRHLSSKKIILLIGIHLMTESKDSSSINEFHGEVRSGELQMVKRILHENPALMLNIDAVVFTGDFNTDVSERDILRGTLKSVIDISRVLKVDTGFEDMVDSMNPSLNLSLAVAKVDGSSSEGIGLPSPPSKSLDILNLHEAYSDVHQWGLNVGNDKSCTSFNVKRCSWIDLMWYSSTVLKVAGRVGMSSPSGTIPDKDHSSDHLPLGTVFEF